MPRTLIKQPSQEMLEKWGVLAYVDENERQRILQVSHGKFRGELQMLEDEVEKLKKPKKKKSVWDGRYYNPKLKHQQKEIRHDDTDERPDDADI